MTQTTRSAPLLLSSEPPARRRLLAGLAVLCALLLVAPAAALAQDEPDTVDEEEQAAQHFAAGRKLYDEGKYPEAIEELKKAYELRPAPPILLNIARTYEKLGDHREALKFYKEFQQKALLSDPNRPMVEKVVAELEKRVGGETGAVTTAAGTETPSASRTTEEREGLLMPARKGLIHTPVDSTKVRQAATILAELPPNVEADRLVLHVRRAGELSFQDLPMEAQGEAFVATIPPRLLTSTSLQYFIEAHKGTGKRSLVATAGSKGNPFIIVVEGGRAPGQGPTAADIKSPYRTWVWVGAAGTAAFVGASLATMLLARDRASAMEQWVRERSCDADCQQDPLGQPLPKYHFDVKARDWESEGQTFATMSGIFLGVGIATAGATAALFYLDRQHIRRERARLEADAGGSPQRYRVAATPWAGAGGAGLIGRIDF